MRSFVKNLWMLILGVLLLAAGTFLESRGGDHVTDPKSGIVYNCLGDTCHKSGGTQ